MGVVRIPLYLSFHHTFASEAREDNVAEAVDPSLKSWWVSKE